MTLGDLAVVPQSRAPRGRPRCALCPRAMVTVEVHHKSGTTTRHIVCPHCGTSRQRWLTPVAEHVHRGHPKKRSAA